MNAQQLKNSILQEAIEGRLVPQDPNDEPASILLERIRKEKAKLVKEGKLKKKDLEVKPIAEDKIPFELPKGWGLYSLKSLSLDSADGPFGSNLKKEHYTESKEVRIIQLSNIGENGWKDTNVKYTTYKHLESIKRSEVFAGDIVIAKMMPAGRAIICPSDDNKYVLSSDAVRFNFSSSLNKKYLYFAINSIVFRRQVYENVQGITRVRTSLTKLREYYLPIPPLAEQHRIVERIEELLPKIEEYGKAQEALDKLNAELPERLKKSILQEAIMGELGTQNPNDEPASTLLDKIRKEKKRLVKEGKLKKKDLEEKPIAEDEKPFNLPEGWEWCRIGNVAEFINGLAFKPDEWEKSGTPIIRIQNLTNRDKPFNYTRKVFDKIFLVKNGDLLFSWSATLDSFIWKGNDAWLNQHIFKVIPYICIDKFFLYYLLKSIVTNLSCITHGLTMKHLTRGVFESFVIGIPPLDEQHRIVEKIETLFAEIDKMIIKDNSKNKTEETEKE